MKGHTALVISGGGSKGAFGGGVAQYLIEEKNRKYDRLYGTSTGSLLTPFLAVEELEELKRAYTSVTQDDIFTLNPFKIKQNKGGVVKTEINYWNVFKNIVINKKNTFGDSSKLRKLIDKFMTDHYYKAIQLSGKEVQVCVTNITLGKTEYKSTNDYEREDFCDYMYASACAPPFMSIVEKEGYEYVDGGLVEHAPIQKAIDDGATEIDVIVLREEGGHYKIEKIRNVFHLVMKMFDVTHFEISLDDIQISKLKAEANDVKLNIYYTPRKLTNNSLIFDKEIMDSWWTEGFESAKADYCKSYELCPKKKARATHNGLTPRN